jgi:hypothetical protein
LLNQYLSEMHTEVYRRYRRLFDSRSVLSSKRFYDFSRRSGGIPTFARFDLPEGSSDDERIAMASAVDAARTTLARTETFQYLVSQINIVEDVTNWSLSYGDTRYKSGIEIHSRPRDRSRPSSTGSTSVGLDSRFALERIVDDPGEIVELRARYERYVEVSVFPIKQQIEMRSPLLRGKRYDVSAAFNVGSGFDRTDFLVSFNLRF